MKVLLTHGYFLADDPKEQRIMKPYAPLGILYLAAYLEQRGTAVEVFDTTFSTRADLERRLLAARPDVVGVYTNLMTKIGVLATVRFIRSRPELAHTRVVLGGPEITHHVDRFLGHGADVVVIGEGEETMHELVSAWRSGKDAPLGDVAGVAFRDPVTAQVVRTAARALLKSLDELPMPKREAVDLQPYLNAWRERHGTNAVSVSTMRGCPYSCRWCSRAVYGGSYRRRSPTLVADEIQHIVDRYHPDSLWFVDDVFTINHTWLQGLTDELERRNLHVPYECITRADRLNERAVALLRQSGCFRVWIGAESGSQKILDAMDRRVTVEQVRDMIQLSKKHGMQTGTFIMLGYPGETEADIEATIEHLKEADPDQFTITVSYPIKGTPLYDDAVELRTDPGPWEQSTDRDIKLRHSHSSLYYWFATARVQSEVKHHKLLARANGTGGASGNGNGGVRGPGGVRPALAMARARAKVLLTRAGMRIDPALRALEDRARSLLGAPPAGDAGGGSGGGGGAVPPADTGGASAPPLVRRIGRRGASLTARAES
jgi:anaerobic magnesium-protoporphyrin IX monomethyl ester cyclase